MADKGKKSATPEGSTKTVTKPTGLLYRFNCMGCGSNTSHVQPWLCGLGEAIDGRPVCKMSKVNPADWDWNGPTPGNTVEKASALFDDMKMKVEANAVYYHWIDHLAVLELLAHCIAPIVIHDAKFVWAYQSPPLGVTPEATLNNFITCAPFTLQVADSGTLDKIDAVIKTKEAERRSFQSQAEAFRVAAKSGSEAAGSTVQWLDEKRKLKAQLAAVEEQLASVQEEMKGAELAKLKSLLDTFSDYFNSDNDFVGPWAASKAELLLLAEDRGLAGRKAILRLLGSLSRSDTSEERSTALAAIANGIMAMHGDWVSRGVGAVKKWMGRAWNRLPNVGDRLAKYKEAVKNVWGRYTAAKARFVAAARSRTWWSITKADVANIYTSVKVAWVESFDAWWKAPWAGFRAAGTAVLGTVGTAGKAVYNGVKKLFGYGIAPFWPSLREAQANMKDVPDLPGDEDIKIGEPPA